MESVTVVKTAVIFSEGRKDEIVWASGLRAIMLLIWIIIVVYPVVNVSEPVILMYLQKEVKFRQTCQNASAAESAWRAALQNP